MLDVIKIDTKEFINDCLDMYESLFPESERRPWSQIEKTYNEGVENFYKIVLNNEIIGFFMMEKLEDHPYYLEYFGIKEEHQNKGYGSLSIRKLIDLCKEGIVGEIEEVNTNNETLKRFEFYKRLGFNLINHQYELYEVLYNPIVYNYNGNNIDDILFDYYRFNMGEDLLKKNCKIIKGE